MSEIMTPHPGQALGADTGGDDSAVADGLAPASFVASLRALRRTPHAPGVGMYALFFASMAGVLFSLMATAGLSGRIVDVFTGQQVGFFGTGRSAVLWCIAIMAVLVISEQLLRVLARYTLDVALKRVATDIRQKSMRATLKAPTWKLLTIGTGNIMTRLTKDIDDFVSAMSTLGFRFLLAIFMFPATLVSLVVIDWRFLVPFAALVCVMWVPLRRDTGLLPRATNVAASREGERNTVLLDSIGGLETIRALGVEEWSIRRATGSSWRAVRARLFVAPIVSRLIGQAYLAFGLYLIAVMSLAAWLAYRGHISVGEAAATLIIVMRLELPIFNVVMMVGQIQEAFTSLGRAVALSSLTDASNAPPGPTLTRPPRITVDHVDFAYGTGSPVLRDVSVSFAPGVVTAIVGASGAGKSTLATLLAGLARPTSGRILIDDTDIAKVSEQWTASTVVLMSQESHVFSGTLRDDLTLAKHDADDEELLAALTIVGLPPEGTQFRRFFPQGLDTQVGHGAAPLPPAVAQQIGLARVVLVDPPVVLMDEATSEAGSEQAQVLEEAARRVVEGRTSIVVAHRLDQAITADRILVMDHGKIVEDGSHEQLIHLGGRYSQLFHAWAEDRHVE